MNDYREIGRSISIIQRLRSNYFAKELSSYQIGCGQQFFLLQIADNPGLSLQELALQGHYDKATATRAVQKLEEEGYVRMEMDPEDRRLRHLYVTEKASPVIEETRKILKNWGQKILKDISPEERVLAERLLQKMAANAYEYMEQQKRKE